MNDSLEVAKKTWRLPWAFVPATLLIASALGVGSMAVVAVRDPHFATEADYYQKALHWDQTQAQAGENQRLGYRLTAPASLAVDQHGHALLEIKLDDATGHPLRGASLTAQSFANAYSGNLTQLAFQEQAPGVYVANLTVHRAGLWIFRVAAQADAARFTCDLRVVLLAGGAA